MYPMDRFAVVLARLLVAPALMASGAVRSQSASPIPPRAWPPACRLAYTVHTLADKKALHAG
jgi:hypothetical protein